MSAEINGRIILPSPVGKLLLEERGGALVRLSFENQISGPLEQRSTPFLEQAAQQLAEYFRGERQEFSLALTYEGTAFQKKVWQALREIPYGQTRSYGQVAQMAGSPKASRAVGMASHNNPIAIIIPCHRVIGANGKLVGFGGGLPVKEKLLALEAEFRESNRKIQ